jgi:predicted heme/steroid binding protein
MKLLSLTTLTLLTLLPFTLHAEQGKIDMHGGKETKAPSAIPAQRAPIFYGKVLEIKPAMGYKYLKIQEQGKQTWVAIANAPVKVGDKIGFDKKTMMKDFKSKSLGQEFKEIYFASDVYLPQKATGPKSMKEMLGLGATDKKDPHAGMGRGMSAEPENETPAKPFVKKDAYTIEEIHMWRKELKDQTITLEGTVFKVSHGIMKRDWVHLGDGSGNEKKLTDDLVFTAPSTTLKAGDKVKATGKVVIDKDFGYGYFYKVIIENTVFEVK